MRQIVTGPCGEKERAALAALFYRRLSRDAVFSAAFPDPKAGLSHCRQFVEEYGDGGVIHRLCAGDNVLAAALWSPPGSPVPSPTWEGASEEDGWKLYLLASEVPGGGRELIAYARGLWHGRVLLTVCGAPWQADYFRRCGFRAVASTPFGTVLRLGPGAGTL